MDTNLKPKISIITLTKDRARFIPFAIKSAEEQTFTDWEMIVVDNGSNDDTEAIVSKYAAKDGRIKYYKDSPTLGISKSRNLGLSLSEGKYIAVLDSDDKWIDKNKLKKQFDFLENNPDYVLIGSNMKIVDENDNFIENTNFRTEDFGIRTKIMIANQISHSTVMFRKECAEKVCGYDNNLPQVEDLDLFLKMGRLGKMKNLNEITTAYTRHSGGISQKRKIGMAWCHLKIVLRNFCNYPNWIIAVIFAKLRLLKNLIF